MNIKPHLLAAALLLFSCHKEPLPQWEVMYRVLRTDGNEARYNVSYTTGYRVTKIEGPVIRVLWESAPALIDDGERVDFALNLRAGDGRFLMEILKNGSVISDSAFSSPIGTTTLTAVI